MEDGRVEKPFQGFVVEGGEGPFEPGGGSAGDGVGDRGLADAAGDRSVLPALAARPDKAQNLSNFT